MPEHEPRMHEIERSLGQRIAHDVVAAHIEIRTVGALKKSRIDVGRDHMSGRPDPIAQPIGHRAGAAADFEAMPSRGDSEVGEMTHGAGIEDAGQCR
jgi:hypothetical protein